MFECGVTGVQTVKDTAPGWMDSTFRMAVFGSTRWDEMKLYSNRHVLLHTVDIVPREEAANYSPKQKPSRFCR